MNSGHPRTRVLFVLPTLTPGGAERVVVTLLRHLDRARFEPSLAVVNMRGAVYGDELPEDVELIDLDCRRVRHAIPRLIWEIRRRRPDVVFTTLGYLNLALIAVRPLLPAAVRFIGREATILSEDVWDFRYPHLWLWAYRQFYPRFDALVCQSSVMRDDIIARAGFPAGKAALIHNPVEVERIRRLAEAGVDTGMVGRRRAPGAPLELIAAGRLSHEKGYDLLIEALAEARDVALRLTVIGDGEQRAALESLAVTLGVADRVRFAGFQRNPYPFLAHADALVLSSRYEGFPNVVLEALALETAVIAVPAPGGISDIARITGGVRLATERSATALAAELRRFAADRRPRERVSLAAFATQAIVQQYQDLFAGPGLATGTAA